MKMKEKLALDELEMVNGGSGIWDVLFDNIKESFSIVDEKYIEPAINKVVLVTNRIIDEAADEAVQLGYKIYDVI